MNNIIVCIVYKNGRLNGRIYTISKNNKKIIIQDADSYYYIPDYQRPYSWDSEEIVLFLMILYRLWMLRVNEKPPIFLGQLFSLEPTRVMKL